MRTEILVAVMVSSLSGIAAAKRMPGRAPGRFERTGRDQPHRRLGRPAFERFGHVHVPAAPSLRRTG